jgi:hypothetical protein
MLETELAQVPLRFRESLSEVRLGGRKQEVHELGLEGSEVH